jgi:1-acyl-sn-glycerol-3-phosphate acyltransferase
MWKIHEVIFFSSFSGDGDSVSFFHFALQPADAGGKLGRPKMAEPRRLAVDENHKVIDPQNIPAGNCLFLFNHTSFFDIFSLFSVVPVRYGAKIELFSIPFFGQAMKAFGILPIARSNRQEVFKVYEDVIKKMQPGDRFALSPEGGRNKEEKLLPFKTGPFVFAIQARIPIVPVVIRGARDIMPKGSFIPNPWHWHRQIEIRFLPAVEVSSHDYDSRNDLQSQVYNEMKPYFAE